MSSERADRVSKKQQTNRASNRQEFRASSIAVRNKDELFAERLDILFSGQITATVGTLLCVLLLVLLQFDHADAISLLTWLGYMAFISLCRVVAVGIYGGQGRWRRNPDLWYRLYVAGTLLQALGWGATMLGFSPWSMMSTNWRLCLFWADYVLPPLPR